MPTLWLVSLECLFPIAMIKSERAPLHEQRAPPIRALLALDVTQRLHGNEASRT